MILGYCALIHQERLSGCDRVLGTPSLDCQAIAALSTCGAWQAGHPRLELPSSSWAAPRHWALPAHHAFETEGGPAPAQALALDCQQVAGPQRLHWKATASLNSLLPAAMMCRCPVPPWASPAGPFQTMDATSSGRRQLPRGASAVRLQQVVSHQVAQS